MASVDHADKQVRYRERHLGVMVRKLAICQLSVCLAQHVNLVRKMFLEDVLSGNAHHAHFSRFNRCIRTRSGDHGSILAGIPLIRLESFQVVLKRISRTCSMHLTIGFCDDNCAVSSKRISKFTGLLVELRVEKKYPSIRLLYSLVVQ
jgi:hypothetical protein